MKGKQIGFYFWLVIIVGLGIVFRLYNFEKGFLFAHDQDLYSWIAKDIVVNHHNRLVGQITSVDGVFIGSFYYYLMAIFYALFNMNPLAAIIPVTMIGIFNILSVFGIFKRHFGTKTAYIGGFIYAVSFGIASFERWSVPTQPTLTWSIWFLAVIIELYKGNLKFLPLYGFLSAFTWQLHIALLPILPIPIVAFILGNNRLRILWQKQNIKIVFFSIVLFIITLSPFLIFEFKHNFSQIKSMAVGISKDAGGPKGIFKIIKVIDASGREFQQRLMYGNEIMQVQVYWIVILLITIYLVRRRKIDTKLLFTFGIWYFLILLAQFTSKRIVSEYYFTNLIPIFLLLLSNFLANILNTKQIILAGVIYISINYYWLVTKSETNESLYYRRQVVEFIRKDVRENNYKCIAINFIANPGVGVGFRYLFWLNDINLVKPGTPGVPVYNISIPWQITSSEEATHYGRFGIVLPKEKIIDSMVCGMEKYQLDPLLGYTE